MDKSFIVKELIRYYGNGNNSAFASLLGVKPQTVSTWISRNTFDIDLVFAKCEDVSADWLLTGKGSMLISEKESTTDLVTANSVRNLGVQEYSNAIPLVYQSAVAGFGSADFSIGSADVKDYYVVPKFKYCRVDFMIELSGSSMYPKYNSGDVVACTILHEKKFIQWNKCHIIATREQGLLCKRLKKSDQSGYITAISDNNNYDPFDIPEEEITGIALVVGVIRLE